MTRTEKYKDLRESLKTAETAKNKDLIDLRTLEIKNSSIRPLRIRVSLFGKELFEGKVLDFMFWLEKEAKNND